MKVSVSEFNAYLNEQVGQPYLWGGQHTKLTPQNCESVIAKRESDPQCRANAMSFCKAKFDRGAAELYAYDCSGLGMYYLQNVTGVFGRDMNANGMMGQCEAADLPKCGCWVFRLGSDGKATHIGYLISDTEVVHAKGRAYGVVKETYKPSYWHRIGKPKCIEFDEPQPEGKFVRVKGNVHVREGNGTGYKAIGTAHKGDLLPYFGQAADAPNWYEVEYRGQRGYITSKPKYTEVIA